jgi:hypothetical protein
MAISVNVNELPENTGGSKETKVIKEGNRPARLVGYVELGMHNPTFAGKREVYTTGKNAGKPKSAALYIALTFEFPNEERTGEYPLTLNTSSPAKNKPHEFYNSLAVSQALIDGTISKAMALKSNYVKYLSALQTATGKEYTSLKEFAEDSDPLFIKVTHNTKRNSDGNEVVYVNMRPDGVMSCKIEDPISGDVVDYSSKVNPKEGEYAIFDWDAPTKESWEVMKPWHREAIKQANNFPGSPIDLLLNEHPELNKLDEMADVNGESGEDDVPEPSEPTPIPQEDDIPV